VTISHIESFENRIDEGLLAKAAASDGSAFLAVDFGVKELACRAEIGDLELF
jgi:hypothetical protein